MLGVYSLVSFLKSQNENHRFGWLVVGAFLLGFAGGTREPYVALEMGAILVVVIAAFRHPSTTTGSRYSAKGLAVLSILFFLVPTAFMLYANTATTSAVGPLASGILESITAPPSNAPAPVITRTFSQNVTEVIVQNSTTTTRTTEVVSTTTSTISYPFYAKSVPLNTIVIFVGGIFLGWGPIAFAIGLAGLTILARATIRKDSTAIALFILVLASLASDLVVSFLFAPDPTYFSFTNYSTIIRFSGTALPAFFLTAPFFLSFVSKRKTRAIGLAAVTIAFLLILIPAYETFAISNL